MAETPLTDLSELTPLAGANRIYVVSTTGTATGYYTLLTTLLSYIEGGATAFLLVANDLSDLNDAATARTNLGLGTAAVEDLEITYNDVNNTTYTFVAGDANNVVVRSTSGSATTFTVPANATVAFATGTVIGLAQNGAGTLTIAAAGGVTINSLNGNLALAGQYGRAALEKTATNTWALLGALA